MSTLNGSICKICGSEFSNYDILRFHLVDVHSMIKNEPGFEEEITEKSMVEINLEADLGIKIELEERNDAFDDPLIEKNESEDKGQFKDNLEEVKEEFEAYDVLDIDELFIKNESKKSTEKSSDKIIHPEKPYICKQCSKAFSQKVNRDRHEKSCENRICPCCNKKFTRIVNLRRHQESVKAKNDPEFAKMRYTFSCKLCSKTFTSQKSAINHEKTIHSDKKYHCDYCAKAFGQKVNKTRHEKTCLKKGLIQLPFECTICLSQFTLKDSLLRHMRQIHKGEEGIVERKKAILEEKPFSCEKCKKKFAHIRNLKNHKAKNNCGTKQCKFCDKTFEKQKRLTVHERTHTKLFSCKYCGKRLSLATQKRIHEKSCGHKKLSNIEESICKICGSEFGNNTQLQFHLSDVHSKIKNEEDFEKDDHKIMVEMSLDAVIKKEPRDLGESSPEKSMVEINLDTDLSIKIELEETNEHSDAEIMA